MLPEVLLFIVLFLFKKSNSASLLNCIYWKHTHYFLRSDHNVHLQAKPLTVFPGGSAMV